MCRWAAFIGQPIFLEQVISAPAHSLLVQSQAAEEAKTAINADGFGVAWYAHLPTPGLYRDVLPAWSDPNLASIARQIRSGLFLAHVRASTGSAISRNNCHPFASGNWSFMHNGQIGGFENFRRSADMLIPDELYGERKGATDSEVLFLRAMHYGLDHDPGGALCKAARDLHALSRERGETPHLRLSVAMSDGNRLFAARASSDHIAPTVYYRRCEKSEGWMVVSEPLEDGQAGWIELPPGKLATFTQDEVSLQDFCVG
ncbi:class II glutamine amidotransferase [Halocynthiibacter sp.]|uniref:class II glutamine amidotransferase n=1 Tax=Halocynthiibacter sp. TaxID=1979210 RepID=UPI003C4DEA31